MKQKLVRLLQTYYPALTIGLFFLFVFRKVFLRGLLPFPGDLLVSFFFPYKSGGWEGFVEFVSHKEYIAADVIRQIYPWRLLAIDMFKQFQFPLWNPYAFSGTPLLANLQSAVFYPLNVIFFVFSGEIGWLLYVMLQPLLAGWFMFLFLRSLKLDRPAALFAGISFGYISYTMIWFELGVVGHTALWLPLVLWGITKWLEKQRLTYLLISAVALACSLVAGHAQTAVYCLIIGIAYYLTFSNRRIPLMKMIRGGSIFLLAIGLAAIQLLPSLELLSLSARNTQTSAVVFYSKQLPLSHLVMLLAPDFFGNPAVNNFWGSDYNEFIGYVGIIAFVLACGGVYHFRKNGVVKFFLILSAVALLFALPTPFSALLQILQIPVLGTGIPARALFILQFSLIVLSGYGVQQYLSKKGMSFKPLIFVGIVYVLLWGFVLFLPSFDRTTEVLSHMSVAKRNLVLPSVLFMAIAGLFVLSRFQKKLKTVVIILLFVMAAIEYSYLFYKYLPFSQRAFMFPQHPLVTYLQKVSPPYRVYGYDTARIETNLPTQWKVYSVEGYDPLYIRRYGELLYAAQKGKYVPLIPRSDALLASSLPRQDNENKVRMMNILGIKYAVDKNDKSQGTWEPDYDRFPTERFVMRWQNGRFKAYENLRTLPRSAVFYDWEIIPDKKTAIERFLSRDFPYEQKLILEQPVASKPSPQPFTPVKIISYTPNIVELGVDAKANGVLFLSDAYYPGWNAYIDSRKERIIPADYALRGVPISRGSHTIVMRYEPFSFYFGALITLASIVVTGSLFAWSYIKERKPNAKHTKRT